MDVRAAVREVVRRGDRGNPPPSTWADLLAASGLDAEQASTLPQRLGLAFHLGAYDEDAVTAQLRQWADALRVRGMPDEAARLDAAVQTLTADPAAGSEPEAAGAVPVPVPEPVPQPGSTPRSEPAPPPDPEPGPVPAPEPTTRVAPQAAAARTPLSPVRPSAPSPDTSSGTTPTGSGPPSAPATPFRRSVLVWALVLILGGPLLLGLLGVLSSNDSGRDRATTWTPPTVTRGAQGPDAGSEVPRSRSETIAESEVLSEVAVDQRLAAEADRVVAAMEQAAQPLGIRLAAPTREQDRYSCDLLTGSRVPLYTSTLLVETEDVDEATALALISALPDDPSGSEESLPYPRLDGSITRSSHRSFGDSRGRPRVTVGALDAEWSPGTSARGQVSVQVRSPCHLLEADREDTAAGAPAVPALEQPWVRAAEGGPTAAEVEQWWETASTAVPRAVEAGAQAAGVELTLVEVGPRTSAHCAAMVGEDGTPFHGRATAWASRQSLTDDQARQVWAHVQDLAPGEPRIEEEDPAARFWVSSKVQALEGRTGYRHLGRFYSSLRSAYAPEGTGQVHLTLDSPCGVG